MIGKQTHLGDSSRHVPKNLSRTYDDTNPEGGAIKTAVLVTLTVLSSNRFSATVFAVRFRVFWTKKRQKLMC